MDYMPGQLRVQLHFAFQDIKYLYMVMDYMPGQLRIRMIHGGLKLDPDLDPHFATLIALIV
jgi:hypothetical protein